MDNGGKLVTFAALGVGGWFVWKEFLDPYLKQKKLEAEAKALAAKKGISYQDALAQVAAAACKVYAKSQGVPGNPVSNAACDLAGKLASIVVVKGGKLAIKGLKVAGRDVVAASEAVAMAPVAGAKAVAGATVSVVKKLKFWGLEGISC